MRTQRTRSDLSDGTESASAGVFEILGRVFLRSLRFLLFNPVRASGFAPSGPFVAIAQTPLAHARGHPRFDPLIHLCSSASPDSSGWLKRFGLRAQVALPAAAAARGSGGRDTRDGPQVNRGPTFRVSVSSAWALCALRVLLGCHFLTEKRNSVVLRKVSPGRRIVVGKPG